MKKDLHAEVITRYKEYFESKLAINLLDQRKIFSSVEKISKKIIDLMLRHRSKIMSIIHDDIKISQELYDEDYFG